MSDLLQTEDSLTTAAVGGDEQALAQLLERHEEELRRRVAAKIGPVYQASIDAADVLQVTYIEVFLQIREFEPGKPGTFLGWLTRIAENNLLDAIRAEERRKRPSPHDRVSINGGDSCFDLWMSLTGTGTTPSAHAARGEAKNLLDAAIGRLPPDYQAVVREYDIAQKPGVEVAKSMNRSIHAMHMLRARAHDHLRKLLGRSSQFFSDGA